MRPRSRTPCATLRAPARVPIIGITTDVDPQQQHGSPRDGGRHSADRQPAAAWGEASARMRREGSRRRPVAVVLAEASSAGVRSTPVPNRAASSTAPSRNDGSSASATCAPAPSARRSRAGSAQATIVTTSATVATRVGDADVLGHPRVRHQRQPGGARSDPQRHRPHLHQAAERDPNGGRAAARAAPPMPSAWSARAARRGRCRRPSSPCGRLPRRRGSARRSARGPRGIAARPRAGSTASGAPRAASRRGR